MTLQQEKSPNRAPRMRPSRSAWLAVVLAPILGWLTLVLFVQTHDLEDWPRWANPAILLAAYLPAIAGAVLGLRAAWSGTRSAAHAAGVAVGWLAFWVAFPFLLNSPYDSGSWPEVPLRLSALAALIAGAAVEALVWLGPGHLLRCKPPWSHRHVRH